MSNKYEELFKASSAAYDEHDYEKMMSYVTDDYAFYGVTDEGPQLRAKGKAQAVTGLKMVLDSGGYVKGDVVFLKAFGNIVVALEKDQFREGDDVITRQTVGVYEYKGDKMIRAISFPVDDQAIEDRKN